MGANNQALLTSATFASPALALSLRGVIAPGVTLVVTDFTLTPAT